MGIGRFWNSICTKFWVSWWGTDVNDVKSKFLHSAVYYQDASLIDYLIERKADVDLSARHGKYNTTALHYAGARGDLDMVNHLLVRSANANAEDNFGYTPLYYALYKNFGVIASALLNKGAIFSPELKGHSTLLHHAANTGHRDVMDIMLKNGANAGYIDEYGWIPAHYSILKLDTKGFNILKSYTDLRFVNHLTGKTLLHTAASKGFKEAVEALIMSGMHLSYIAQDGHSAIGEAIINGHIDIANIILSAGGAFYKDIEGAELINKAAATDYTRSIEFLLKFGIDINSYDVQGNIPIYYASNDAMIDFLCHNGAIVDFRDKNGYTPLHKAARAGDVNKVKLFLKHKADADVACHGGTTALHDALSIGHSGKAASLLLDSIDSKSQRTEVILKSNIMGNDIIRDAARNGYDDVIEFYYDNRHICKPELTDTLYDAFSNNRINTAKKLKDLGATLDVRVQKNIELLHNAVKNGWHKAADELLKLGINPDNWDVGYSIYGHTTSHSTMYYAIQNNDLKMVDILLSHHAGGDGIDPETGQRYVYHAVLKGNADILKSLINKGGSADIIDQKTGQTLLIFAIKTAYGNKIFGGMRENDAEIIDTIISNSGTVYTTLNAIDPGSGKNALQLAISFDQVRVAIKLMKHTAVKIDIKNDFQEILKLQSSESKKLLTEALVKSSHVDINKKYFDCGQTFLHLAAKNGDHALVEFLKGNGASLKIKNDAGYMPVDVAILSACSDEFLAKLMPEDYKPEVKAPEVKIPETPTHTGYPAQYPEYHHVPQDPEHKIATPPPPLHLGMGHHNHYDGNYGDY